MRRILWLAAIGLTVGLSIPLIYGGRGLFHQLATFPLSLLGAGLAMIVLGWNFSAVRLRLMLHGIGQPMAYGRALAIIIATEFACCATPAGGGGPVAYVFLLKRHGASGTGAAALYALDILMDLLFFATALLAITLAILIQPDQLRVGWQLSLLACLRACWRAQRCSLGVRPNTIDRCCYGAVGACAGGGYLPLPAGASHAWYCASGRGCRSHGDFR